MPMGDPGAGRGQAFVQEWAHSERCRKVRQPTAFDSPGQTHNLAQHRTDVGTVQRVRGMNAPIPEFSPSR